MKNRGANVILAIVIIAAIAFAVYFAKTPLLAPSSSSDNADLCADIAAAVEQLKESVGIDNVCPYILSFNNQIDQALSYFNKPGNTGQTNTGNPVIDILSNPLAAPYLAENIQLLRDMQECLDIYVVACS